jgi:hypothetical protein
MQTAIKLAATIAVILLCTHLGKRVPSLAGLLAVMPLTGLLVFVWLHLENEGSAAVMIPFTRGLLWGILPSILFFLTALVCLKKGLPLASVLGFSFGVWLIGAVVHQILLK